MTEIIAWYFCDTRRKRENLIDLLVNQRLQLGAKVDVLAAILKRDYPEYLKKNGALIQRLKEINKLRTKLAHYRRVGQPKGSDTTLSLEYFKNGVLKTENVSATHLKIRTHEAFHIRYNLLQTLYLVSKGESKLLPRVNRKAIRLL